MRIRILIFQFDADPDFYLMRMRIQVTKIMRIHVDLDPLANRVLSCYLFGEKKHERKKAKLPAWLDPRR